MENNKAIETHSENPTWNNLHDRILIYEKILEISDDGFLIVDRDGTIIEMNKAYLEFLELKKQNVIGRHVTDVILNSKLGEITKSGREDVNVVHKLASGQSPNKDKYVIVTRAPVSDGNKVIAAVGQIKFTRNALDIAAKLKAMDDEVQYYRKELERFVGSKYSFQSMIGESAPFNEAIRIAKKAAKSDMSVLLTGETGTGKEVFANAIHYDSERKNRPIIRINCAAIPAELMESELFGYAEGSFTGAVKGGKKGKFELANGGTVFLDEIGDMPLTMQAKLLRVLQEKELEKVGSSETIPVDVRIISATNQNLEDMVRNGTFREDLYYRLNVIRVEIPPLRVRMDDIELFVEAFLADLNEKYDTDVSISEDALKVLKQYKWPGNIRELKNVIDRSYSLVDDSIITFSQLPKTILVKNRLPVLMKAGKTLPDLVDDFEKEILISYLEKNSYNCVKTAEELGIHRATLYNKIEKLNIKIRD
ncbi:sigma-54 interaction domain-containing protein [Youngiibacter multivorans]|uniref:PAS domain S-box-containing protein n=1 Tax=Youngiibacter multivorans TaxID=937251 RepID=A0ABS4G7Z4_9CLOT|nr:sigma 54-interacting transcriptional regulator [Youngiibacter multivorans]MBP1920682.1 PAS domain S-box-containing protein [Youngiibacter multivorans]